MRPQGFYVVWTAAFALALCQGYQTARQLSPQRSYVRFHTRVQAEEFAMWWEHEHPPHALGITYTRAQTPDRRRLPASPYAQHS